MRFYTRHHQFYCGIDLHARSMYVCIMDQSGKILLHRNFRANPEVLIRAPSTHTAKISWWRWSAFSPGTGLLIYAAGKALPSCLGTLCT